MSYYVVIPQFGFKELPDRILVREDGAYGDHEAHGTPIINYWYVLEQRIPPTEREIISAHLEQLEADNAKLREFIYDLIVDEERGHNDDVTFREHVIRAHECGIAQGIEVV